MQVRTQIYLDPTQHAALLKESRRLRISLAGVIRKLVEDHILKKSVVSSADQRRKAALDLIGLGESGFSDVSQKTDEYLAGAIAEDRLNERPARYRHRRRKAK
jgi:hypothetical protein